MDGNFNLEQWLINAVQNTKNDGMARDFHVSDFFHYSKCTRKDKVLLTFNIFNEVSKVLSNLNLNGIGVFLSINLVNSRKKFNAPKNLIEIESLWDSDYVPEIIVYKPYFPEQISLIEIYRVPLLFNVYDFENTISVFYKEFRTKDEIINKENFNRELNIVYNPQFAQ